MKRFPNKQFSLQIILYIEAISNHDLFLGNKPSVAKSVDDDVQYAQSGDMMFSPNKANSIEPEISILPGGKV